MTIQPVDVVGMELFEAAKRFRAAGVEFRIGMIDGASQLYVPPLVDSYYLVTVRDGAVEKSMLCVGR